MPTMAGERREESVRKLTREEKLAEWEQQRRLTEQAAGGGQCMPEDEARHL